MEVLGIIFLVLIAIAVLAAVTMTLISIPDIRRYLRMRKM